MKLDAARSSIAFVENPVKHALHVDRLAAFSADAEGNCRLTISEIGINNER
jgi:hypothetical protein